MTVPVKVFPKDPSSILNYEIDWTNGGANDGGANDHGWLQGDTIKTSIWTLPTGITKVTDSTTTTKTTIWVSGGTAGESYDVVNTITTNSTPSKTEQRTIRFEVQER
jgi:hypothetical protein